MLGYTISVSPLRFPPPTRAGGRRCVHELGAYRLCSASGSASATGLRVGRRTLWRRTQAPAVLVHGSTAVHGIRPAHQSFEPARDRHLPAGVGLAALSLRHPRRAGAEHTCSSQRASRLPYFHGHGLVDDCLGTDRVARRRGPPTPERSRLRRRLHDHRPVSQAVPLGAVPPPQGGRQGATR